MQNNLTITIYSLKLSHNYTINLMLYNSFCLVFFYGLASVSQSFAFYMDESGSPKPNIRDSASYFAVGGVLIRRQDESNIHLQISKFKERWSINDDIPLHGNEIRSRKKNFAWLGRLSTDEQNNFLKDLTSTVIQCPIIVHGCVISRQGYLERYLSRYGSNTWEMMRSAFSILLDRIGKYIIQEYQNEEVMIYFEKAGKKEDRLIINYFNEFRTSGHPFNISTSNIYNPLSSNQINRVFTGIESKAKLNPILQVADLCLYPVARRIDQPQNIALHELQINRKLIDSVLEADSITSMGIKYYCFDNSH